MKKMRQPIVINPSQLRKDMKFYITKAQEGNDVIIKSGNQPPMFLATYPQVEPLKPDADLARAIDGEGLKRRLHKSIDKHFK
ncbi:MAG: hypothetical protein LIO77_05500 [Rikenellaceae bacterium]|nr:hypothetical protein [Rikenellaceae bacterium]